MPRGAGTFELTPLEEIKRRVRELQNRMEEKGIDLALLLQNVDLFYFTGTIQKSYLFVPREGEATYFVEKNYERAVMESPLRCIKVASLDALPNLLCEYGLKGKRVGMELDVVPVSLYKKIRNLFGEWEVLSISTEIKRIRSIKSDFEIRQIKRSGEIVTEVFSKAKVCLREGMSELELDAILTSLGRSLGHQGLVRMRGCNQEMVNIYVLAGDSATMTSCWDTPISGYGMTPAIAQGSSARIVGRDQPILIDYGAGYNGYVTDETRVFVIGRLKDHLERAWRVALDIIEEVESCTRAGVLPFAIYERGQEIARKEGLTPNFMGHGEEKVAFVGHGLGLELNEWPIISKGNREPLQSGMVFAFEPKFIFPGEGAVGIELDYIVRDDGLERVTQFPKEMIFL